jgi:hypothetical protein
MQMNETIFRNEKIYIYVIQVNVVTYIKLELERSNKDFVSKISFSIHDCTNLIIILFKKKKTFIFKYVTFHITERELRKLFHKQDSRFKKNVK